MSSFESSCSNGSPATASNSGSFDGAKDANTRGLEGARQLLANYEPPPLDPAIDEALQTFIREREAVLPDNVA